MTKVKWRAAIVAAATLAIGGHATAAPARVFCFSPAYAAWRGFPLPTIDGVIDFPNEKGWSPAFKYVFSNGTMDPDVTLYGFSNNAGILEMGFSVRNDKTYDATDTILILFDTGASGGTNHYGELVITPLDADIKNQSGAPAAGYAHYFVSSNPDTGVPGQWVPSGSADPGWLSVAKLTVPTGNCASGSPGTQCRWDVELKIDTAASGAPPLTHIQKIFVDVLRADRSAAGAKTNEFTWPPGPASDPEQNYTSGDFVSGTPVSANWGGAAVASPTACNGVWFRGMGASITDITSDTGTTSHGMPSFTRGSPVTLTAHIHNSTVDGTSGAGIAAAGVRATFYHAPFGMSGFNNFILMPSSGGTTNPTSTTTIAYDGATDPTTTGAGTLRSVTWTPSVVCDGSHPDCDTDHQCIMVQLDAPTTPDTAFINQGEFQNMWGNPMSTFAGPARISVKGLKAPDGGGAQRIQLSTTRAFQFAYGDGGIAGIPIGTLASQMKWMFHGQRFTGRYITIKGIKHEIWAPVASFGYELQHALTADVQAAFETRHTALITSTIRSTLANGVVGVGTTGHPGTTGGTVVTTGTVGNDGTVVGGTGPTTTTNPGTTTGPNPGTTDPRVLRALNAALAADPEQPAATDWNMKVDTATLVEGTSDVYELSIPVDGQVTLPVSAGFGEVPGGGGNGTCNTCFCCNPAVKTASTGSTLGMLLMIGAVIHRRKRRG